MEKFEIIARFEEMTLLLKLNGANPFQARAYEKAARILSDDSVDLDQLIADKNLDSLKGIGKDLAEKITTLYYKDHLPALDALRKQVPKELIEMLAIPNLGPKKIRALDKHGISSIEQLKKACQEGHIATIEGFGEKTEQNLFSGIKKLQTYNKRHLWWSAYKKAKEIAEALKELNAVKKVEIAGSLRRKLETVGDIDLLVETEHPEDVIKWFCQSPFAHTVIEHGKTKASIRLEKGFRVDLRVVEKKSIPFALIYFTGSKEHTIKLRGRAKQKGWTLNEYGFGPQFTKQLPKSEKQIYQALDLEYVEPELREDTGEIEAAEKNELPKLITEDDILGVFHCHTTASDGQNSLEEMIDYSMSFNFKYLGISDHSQSSWQARGLDEERLLDQVSQIRALKNPPLRVFAGTECDIRKDGSLDFPNEVLQELDFVIVSLHQPFGHDEKTITNRIIKALENPYTTMLAHPTGRLLLKREGYPVDLHKVIDAAIANGKMIEINGNPFRMDLDWRFWHAARDKGLLTCINPDAHNINGLHFFKTGVNVARKGWLEKASVFNTWDLKRVEGYLGR